MSKGFLEHHKQSAVFLSMTGNHDSGVSKAQSDERTLLPG